MDAHFAISLFYAGPTHSILHATLKTAKHNHTA
jgi:hypothetical protein